MTGFMQGREGTHRGYLDVEALAGELLVPGRVFAFLADHRERFSGLDDGGSFPSGRGRPAAEISDSGPS